MKKQTFVLLVCSLVFAALLFADNPHVPRGASVVVDFSETAQSTAQSTTFTPTADGTFRVSTYVEISGTITDTSSMAVLLSWTDDLQAEAFNSSAGGAPTVMCSTSGSSVRICQATTVIHAKANDTITIGFGTGGTLSLPAGTTYTAYAILEQL